jgi:hypothetical protein
VTDGRVTRREPDVPAANIEAEIDRILMDSFPASDPPQWDSLAAARVGPGPRRSDSARRSRA